jgi:hypothetical protein
VAGDSPPIWAVARGGDELVLVLDTARLCADPGELESVDPMLAAPVADRRGPAGSALGGRGCPDGPERGDQELAAIDGWCRDGAGR